MQHNKSNMRVILAALSTLAIIAVLFAATGCSMFECMVTNCSEPATSGSSFCEKHTCYAPNCNQVVGGLSADGKDVGGIKEACIKHACVHYSDCYRAPVEGFNYCIDHTCKAEGCNLETDDYKPYCKSHACAALCENRAGEGHYCDQHTCKAKNCSDFRNPPDKYCYDHNCVYGGCKNYTPRGKEYCSKHKDHASTGRHQSSSNKTFRDDDGWEVTLNNDGTVKEFTSPDGHEHTDGWGNVWYD